MKTKQCCTCKEIKSVSQFSRNSKHKDGLSANCKLCAKEYIKQYREANKEALKVKKHEDYLKNIDHYKKQHKQYREENSTFVKQIKREEYLRNSDKYKKKAKQWKLENPEQHRLLQIKHKRKRRAIKNRVKENYTPVDEQYTRNLFNNCCACCGSTENLCIDHHKPLSKGFALTRKNAVLLCRQCNSSKQDKDPEEFYSKEVFESIQQKLEV